MFQTTIALIQALKRGEQGDCTMGRYKGCRIYYHPETHALTICNKIGEEYPVNMNDNSLHEFSMWEIDEETRVG